uniref:Uncharacterized protein n=1 Tax=Bubo bubo TaxID=30461 RepID=A0A8C0FMH0_BUBBB
YGHCLFCFRFSDRLGGPLWWVEIAAGDELCTAHCSSELLGSSDLVGSASRVSGTTGMRHHARILFSVFSVFHAHILYSDKAVD